MNKDKMILNDLLIWEKDRIDDVINILQANAIEQFENNRYELAGQICDVIAKLLAFIGVEEEEE